jgi:hypothetical protein
MGPGSSDTSRMCESEARGPTAPPFLRPGHRPTVVGYRDPLVRWSVVRRSGWGCPSAS